MGKNNITSALFDVRPVNERGDLDVAKIRQIKEVLDLRDFEKKEDAEKRKKALKVGLVKEEDLTRDTVLDELLKELEKTEESNLLEEVPIELVNQELETPKQSLEEYYFPEVAQAQEKYPVFQAKIKRPRPITSFLISGFLIALLIPLVAWFGKGLAIKDIVLGSGLSAYQNLLIAKESLEKADLKAAEQNILMAHSDFLEIQKEIGSLPLIEEMLERVLDYSGSFLEILGSRNPRQYLLIFQNNSEIRATGGFIGTYGLLELDQGRITNLFIDGIFNADGQLHEKIIPPRPIQKISTAWSMHDANWFADFPTSAEKISWFYEKTGGPTVDGVISITPTVIERLLKLTGPIDMPSYGVVLDSDNFVELIQYKIEVDYDKELNQPKKILADFVPLFIKKLEELSKDNREEAAKIIFWVLEEKHVLVYFKDSLLEKLAIDQGWAGELKETDKDYLSVVSSNINGFKTDRVIKETIFHQAEIQEDGSVIDTLTIKRKHQGGRTDYDWWNQVNADYLRVYLPLRTQLISVSGQTKENYQPPIDYQAHNFKQDTLVSSIESQMIIDSETGTQIFQENNKTVFGNWVYVSPGEEVVLTYQYKLPFKIDLTKSSDSYSLLIQKQSGSIGSQFSQQLSFPESWRVLWEHNLNYQGSLEKDRFLGATFEF